MVTKALNWIKSLLENIMEVVSEQKSFEVEAQVDPKTGYKVFGKLKVYQKGIIVFTGLVSISGALFLTYRGKAKEGCKFLSTGAGLIVGYIGVSTGVEVLHLKERESRDIRETEERQVTRDCVALKEAYEREEHKEERDHEYRMAQLQTA